MDEQYDMLRNEAEEYSDEMMRYSTCMEELKDRLIVIKNNLARGTTKEGIRYDTEFVCLQFRSIIELIALSNLAAHKKLYTEGIKKLRTEWKAHKIIKYLEKINPDFYPLPVNLNYGELKKPVPSIAMNPIESGYLTKVDFAEVYNSCSNYLHANNPFKEPLNYEIRFKFREWFDKIQLLVAAHTIRLVNQDGFLLAIINWDNPPKNRHVYMMYLRQEGKIEH